MIRIVLGLDFAKRYENAVRLLERLKFEKAHVHAFHAIETVPEFAAFGPGLPYRTPYDSTPEEAKSLVDAVTKRLKGLGMEAVSCVRYGPAATRLMELASEVHADLIAVGSEQKGQWGSLFFGSVSRGLSIDSRESYLVAKEGVKESGPIRAVFATDHSRYCDGCADNLIKMAPKGIQSLTIMTAHWTDISMLEIALRESGVTSSELFEWVEANLKKKNEALAKRFKAAGISCDVRIVQGEPREAIAATMKETGSELLILGARGHGLADRIALGSVAMHEVVVAPHSVLVIRR